MQQNPLSYYQNYYPAPQQPAMGFTPVANQAPANTGNLTPNAVNINIYSPQAYSQDAAQYQNQGMTNPYYQQYPQYYPVYGPNMNPNMPLYPPNYNNMLNQAQPQTNNIPDNKVNALNDTNLAEKTPNQENDANATTANPTEEKTEKKDKDEKKKTITPLTDDYVKNLENYLNNENPKVRLIGAKTLLERFKEDPNRKDHPSLIPLLNKVLRDNNAAVRFLGLTMLQLGYSVGNDETVQILNQIAQNSENKLGEDYALALEALLKLSAPEPETVKEAK